MEAWPEEWVPPRLKVGPLADGTVWFRNTPESRCGREEGDAAVKEGDARVGPVVGQGAGACGQPVVMLCRELTKDPPHCQWLQLPR